VGVDKSHVCALTDVLNDSSDYDCLDVDNTLNVADWSNMELDGNLAGDYLDVNSLDLSLDN